MTAMSDEYIQYMLHHSKYRMWLWIGSLELPGCLTGRRNMDVLSISRTVAWPRSGRFLGGLSTKVDFGDHTCAIMTCALSFSRCGIWSLRIRNEQSSGPITWYTLDLHSTGLDLDQHREMT